MQRHHTNPRQHRGGSLAGLCIALLLSWPALVDAASHDGNAILRMCQGSDKVRHLSIMCHSYLNGYLDSAAWQAREAGKKDPGFCPGAGDKKAMPAKLTLWLRAHPKELMQPAPKLLAMALADLYPCR